MGFFYKRTFAMEMLQKVNSKVRQMALKAVLCESFFLFENREFNYHDEELERGKACSLGGT